MAKLVSNPDQAKKNILSYSDFISGDPNLVRNLSQNRAWYAVKHGEAWCFGNSKIIGYDGLTPKGYDPQRLDGRQTESVLQDWFVEVGPNDQYYDELWDQLAEFLDSFDKKPSKLARINILKSDINPPEEDRENIICDLIVEVVRGLDEERIKTVRNRLKALL